MFNRISFSAIAAMAALSMVSLTACGDENTTSPLIEQPSSSSELELSSSSAPLIELSSSSGESGDSVQVELKCDYVTKGAKTRFLVEQSGEVLKDVCSEPIPVIGDEVYAEDCNVENDGRVLSLWSGNSKYGHMSYYKCQKDSWVKGDISLTCDTAGVAVGDTCVKQNSINIFQAGMNPTGEIVSFVYKGNGVWTKVETEEMARVAK